MKQATFPESHPRAGFRIRRSLYSCAVALFLASSPRADAADARFGGGMGAHFQYADMESGAGRLKGLAWGLGGILHYRFGNHFRVGSMGSTWHLSYSTPGLAGSYQDFGYGGLTAEFCLRVKTGWAAIGIMAGGGRGTNLNVRSRAPGDSITARYSSFSAMVAAPTLSYEHSLTKVISVLVLVDYLIAIHDGSVQPLGSPGLRLGFVFGR